jgi:hypothetical protein
MTDLIQGDWLSVCYAQRADYGSALSRIDDRSEVFKRLVMVLQCSEDSI